MSSIILTPRRKPADVKKLMGATEIEQMFLASTLGRVVIDLGWFPKITNNQQQYKLPLFADAVYL